MCGLGRVSTRKDRADGTAATARARHRGRRSDAGGGCHTGHMENGGVRTGTQGACDAAGRCAGRRNATAASEAAETVPVRMTGGCHQAERLAPPGKACHTCARAYLHSTPCGRPVPVPVWLRSSAASVSTQHCSWQPLRLPHWGHEKRQRACRIDTATSLRSEDGVRQAFRRDASAQRPPVTVPKSNNGDAWR